MTYDDELEIILRDLAEAISGALTDAEEFIAIIPLRSEPTVLLGETLESTSDASVLDAINDAVEQIVETAGRLGHDEPDSIYLQKRGSVEYREVYGDFETITTTIDPGL